MTEIKIKLPKEFEKRIEEHPEIDLSLIIEKALFKILRRIELVDFLELRLNESEFTEEDADRIGELVKQHRLKELKSKGLL